MSSSKTGHSRPHWESLRGILTENSWDSFIQGIIYDKNIKSCASALKLASTNTSAKSCANQACQKLTGEDRRCQKREQLLVRDIEEVNTKGVIHLALKDTKTMFARLLTKPLSWKPLIACQRAESTSQPQAKINLPSPLDGQKLYSLRPKSLLL